MNDEDSLKSSVMVMVMVMVMVRITIRIANPNHDPAGCGLTLTLTTQRGYSFRNRGLAPVTGLKFITLKNKIIKISLAYAYDLRVYFLYFEHGVKKCFFTPCFESDLQELPFTPWMNACCFCYNLKYRHNTTSTVYTSFANSRNSRIFTLRYPDFWLP